MERELERLGSAAAEIEAWNRFLEFRGSFDGPSKRLLHNPNPEIVLTVPDLILAANEAEDRRTLLSILRKQKLDRAMLPGDRGFLNDAEQIRWSLLECIESFIGRRHASDLEEGASFRKTDLPRYLSCLAAGDVVITTNWDTLAERVLAELGRWTPADGYGFAVPVVADADPAPVGFPRPSDVVVLKLHGSIGWRSHPERRTDSIGSLDANGLASRRGGAGGGGRGQDHRFESAEGRQRGQGTAEPAVLPIGRRTCSRVRNESQQARFGGVGSVPGRASGAGRGWDRQI